MKSNRLSSLGANTQFRRKAVALGVAMAIASSAYANPTGMSVVAGQATAQTMGNLMQITNTPGAILNWQQFNIDVGQTTQFIQQNAASQVFNRVTGGDVSQILGTLQSNGQVFLINPAGVFFGQGAVVDTAGFLASTLAASDTDLLNGHLRFNDSTGTAGNIVNQGSLTTHSGGSIVLLAPSIENSGIIHADGEVLLAAGHSVTIVDMKHPTIGLTVASKSGDKAVNLGQIISKNASLFSHLVKNSGVVEATGAQLGEGGVVRFIAQGDALVGGQVLAESTQGQGGEIDITGERVAVLSGARISADGATGGGTVHVGGGWKGQDTTLANAQQTVVQANTHISANATVNGDGGEVVVWADGHTAVDSEVQAKGGALGGNGGRVETSGKQSLAVNVAANTSAAKGEAGQWLLDPGNLEIVATIPAQNGELQAVPNSDPLTYSSEEFFPSPSPTSYLSTAMVVTGLENNGQVTVQASGDSANNIAGNLTVKDAILVANRSSGFVSGNPILTLEADGDIAINAAVGLLEGQSAFNGFDLNLNFDIDKPVYINAPLYLGEIGSLNLQPFDAVDISPSIDPNTQLPLDGVNLRSGMTSSLSGQPLTLNKISLQGAGATPDKKLKLNVSGSNLAVNHLDLYGFNQVASADISVESSDSVPSQLQYSFLEANSLTVGSESTVSTYAFNLFGTGPITATFLNRLTSSGAVTFNGGSTDIVELDTNAGTLNFLGSQDGSGPGFHRVRDIAAGTQSTINLAGSFLQYRTAVLNGSLNMTGQSQSPAVLEGTLTDLGGSIQMQPGLSNARFQVLGMRSGSSIHLNSGTYLGLGRAFPFDFQATSPEMVANTADGPVSFTQGQFLAESGATIVMNGSSSDSFLSPQSFFGSGAVIDITGLDGHLNAPVTIEVNGFANSIQTSDLNTFLIDTSDPMVIVPTQEIENMIIESANIQVDGDADTPSLRIGQIQDFFSSQPPSSGGNLLPSSSQSVEFQPTVGLDFKGSLAVNSGQVLLQGETVKITSGSVNVNGSNALLALSGRFTSADLYAINRSNGGGLAVEGIWDNSSVTTDITDDLASVSPLAKGDILVGDDLVVTGGLLSNAGAQTNGDPNSIRVKPDGFLELRDTEVATTINISPTGVLLLAAQDESGNSVNPSTLSGATINMEGDAFLIVEATVSANSPTEPAVANLNGAATINSAKQGNLILAGRRAYTATDADLIPDEMVLNVGSGIRLNVEDNTTSSLPGLDLFYGSSTPPTRPVFLVGQLTPEAVALAEYDEGFFPPVTTVLSNGFGTLESFVIDGTPDSFAPNVLTCSASDFCVKFDVAQTGTFAGSVITNLNSVGVTGSGVEFAPDLTLNFSQIQTPTEIMLMGNGITTIAASDLMDGRKLLIGSAATAQFLSNAGNQLITNNLENNGTINISAGGSYTFGGLLTGTGDLNNNGSLVLSNGSNSQLTNMVMNNGTITNTGSYSMTNLSSTSTANFVNQGTLNFAGGSYTFGSSGYVQTGGSLTVQPGTQLTGSVNINGGALLGFANINGNLNVSGGRIVPGSSPGLMTVSGDLNLDANSIVDIEIASNGGMRGIDFDCIIVQGNANLAGQLNLRDISGGTLAPGGQYAFLEASSFNMTSFDGVSVFPFSSAYTFSSPVIADTTNGQLPIQQMSTSRVAVSSPPPVTPQPTSPTSPTSLTQSTGTNSTAVGQNLNQAFTPTSTSSTSTTSSGTSGTQSTSTQQEEQAVEVANQNTAGTTISQQSNDIELKTTQSDPQRASAVCK
ncbi:two-partner secretion domain-containing protein [Limnobacter sp.]